jgi:hypothetical protein
VVCVILHAEVIDCYEVAVLGYRPAGGSFTLSTASLAKARLIATTDAARDGVWP